MKYQPKSNEKKLHTFFPLGYSRKKQNRGVEDMEFPEGYLLKKWHVDRNFRGCPRKNYVEFPGVLVFGLGTFKGCNTVLHNCQGWSFYLSGISRGKVNKQKIPGTFVIYRYLMSDSKLR